MVMDLNKHIIPNESDSLFHTSAYAQVANGEHLGAVDTRSFEERQKIERNRQLVAGYSRSTIGQSYGLMRAKPVVNRSINRTSIRPRATLQQHNAISGPPHFSEPKGRTYNPYA